MELLVLCTFLGLGVTGYLWRRGERSAPRQRGEREQAGRRRLPRAGDVVSASGQEDALIEGVVRLEEPGRVAILCQLQDGRILWQRGATEGEDEDAWLLLPAPGGAGREEAWADEIDVSGLRYRLRLRYRAEAMVLSRAPRGAQPALRAGEVLVYEYRSVGAERSLGLHQGGRGGLYVGHAAPGLEILPAW